MRPATCGPGIARRIESIRSLIRRPHLRDPFRCPGTFVTSPSTLRIVRTPSRVSAIVPGVFKPSARARPLQSTKRNVFIPVTRLKTRQAGVVQQRRQRRRCLDSLAKSPGNFYCPTLWRQDSVHRDKRV